MDDIVLKYSPRPQQQKIKEFFIKSVERDKKFILIDAPTGSGKSYLPALLGDWYIKNQDKNAKIDVITCTKILQSQYTKDFRFMSNLWGKNNYYCERHDCTCDEGSEIAKAEQQKCEDCPYSAAFNEFMDSRLSLSNFHMYNSLRIYVSEMLDQRRNSNILFVDESHLYEENFCSFVSNRISPRILSLLTVNNKDVRDSLNKVHTVHDLKLYLEKQLIPILEKKKMDHTKWIGQAGNGEERLRLIKKYNYIDSFICKSYRFLNDDTIENWVIQTEHADDGSKILDLQPIWAKKYINEHIWSKYDHIVLMSGTILNPTSFSKMMGIDLQKTSYLKLEHTFPASRRPVMFLNSGNLSRRHFESSIDNVIKDIRSILKMHKNHKGIIHTANYDLANTIKERIGDNRLIIHETSTRDEAIEKHLASEEATVLVSPSMYTGLDLKNDLSRFQIIVKIPYPYLGSKVIQRRKEQIPSWYNWKTMNDLLQSYGRSIRNMNDWCYTYILDTSFQRFLSKNINITPEYFAEGLQEGRKLLKKLKQRKRTT